MARVASRSLDPQLCALVGCALAPRDISLSPALSRTCGAGFPDPELIERAARYQLRPQLAAQIGSVDTAETRALRASAEAARGRAMLMAGEIVRVLDALRAAGVPAVPFKGPVFAEFVGPGLGARETNDLDIILRPQDVRVAAHTLAPLGYTPILPSHAVASPWLVRTTSELGLLAHDGATLLELHWRLSPHWYPAPCAVEDVMAALGEREFIHGSVSWPAAEELLLVHVADGLKSCGNGLRWVADLAHILRRHPDLDWDRVRRIATGNGGLKSVRVALAVVEALSVDAAQMLDTPALAISLPPEAHALGSHAKWPVARAVHSIRQRLASDACMSSAARQFLWAFSLGDGHARAGAAIARHVTAPTVADLAAMPSTGTSGTRLRWRALRRRVVDRARQAA